MCFCVCVCLCLCVASLRPLVTALSWAQKQADRQSDRQTDCSSSASYCSLARSLVEAASANDEHTSRHTHEHTETPATQTQPAQTHREWQETRGGAHWGWQASVSLCVALIVLPSLARGGENKAIGGKSVNCRPLIGGKQFARPAPQIGSLAPLCRRASCLSSPAGTWGASGADRAHTLVASAVWAREAPAERALRTAARWALCALPMGQAVRAAQWQLLCGRATSAAAMRTAPMLMCAAQRPASSPKLWPGASHLARAHLAPPSGPAPFQPAGKPLEPVGSLQSRSPGHQRAALAGSPLQIGAISASADMPSWRRLVGLVAQRASSATCPANKSAFRPHSGQISGRPRRA